jgi:hypothetical protein
MNDSEYDKPVPLLTTAERTRLRPSVDPVALERFLAAIPDEVRSGVQRAAVLHFSRDVTMTEIRDFLLAVGNDDAAEAMKSAVAAEPADLPTREPDTAPTTPRTFSMDPPHTPWLRELWDAIEPQPDVIDQ